LARIQNSGKEQYSHIITIFFKQKNCGFIAVVAEINWALYRLSEGMNTGRHKRLLHGKGTNDLQDINYTNHAH
jgi:hypothetical protein